MGAVVRKPLAIDLCCGLGGWAEELLAGIKQPGQISNVQFARAVLPRLLLRPRPWHRHVAAAMATKVPGFRFDGTKASSPPIFRNTGQTTPHFSGYGINGREINGSERKAASAMIAKIPAPLAHHIARTFFPAATLS